MADFLGFNELDRDGEDSLAKQANVFLYMTREALKEHLQVAATHSATTTKPSTAPNPPVETLLQPPR